MRAFISTIIAALVLTASPVSAAWLCLNASAAETTSGCTKTVVTTSGGPYVTWDCPTSGDPKIFWNTTMPTDAPAAMEFLDAEFYWLKGASTTGIACWGMCGTVYADGQDYTDDTNYGPCVFGDDTIPTTTLVKKTVGDNAISTIPTAIPQASGAACSAAPDNCRGAPLRIRVNRQTTGGCSNTADAGVQLVKVCFEY